MEMLEIERYTLGQEDCGAPSWRTTTHHGVPVGPKVTSVEVLESFLNRARKSFHAKHEILHSSAPIKSRLLVLDRVVLATMTWALGVMRPTQELTRALNYMQVQMVVSVMMGKRRRPGEGFVESQQRLQRLAQWGTIASARQRAQRPATQATSQRTGTSVGGKMSSPGVQDQGSTPPKMPFSETDEFAKKGCRTFMARSCFGPPSVVGF